MTLCTGVTRQGLPCRNSALLGSAPPRCKRHTLTATVPASAAPISPALTHITPEETRNLTAELRLVRDVLNRLADRLDDPSYTLLPEDLRTLATLIFSGVRTVAYLLSRQEETADVQAWLDQALDTLSADLSTEL